MLEGRSTERTALRLLTWSGETTPLGEGLHAARKLASQVGSEFQPHRAAELEADFAVSLSAGIELTNSVRDSIADIDEWATFVRANRQLADAGLAEATAFCVDQRVPNHDITSILERADSRRVGRGDPPRGRRSAESDPRRGTVTSRGGIPGPGPQARRTRSRQSDASR